MTDADMTIKRREVQLNMEKRGRFSNAREIGPGIRMCDEDDKQYLIFEFDRKVFRENFHLDSISSRADVEKICDNVKRFFDTIYAAGFLTRGISLKIDKHTSPTLNVGICV